MKKTTNTKLKVQTHRYNQSAVEGLSTKFGFSKVYIRQCLRGDRNNITADTIRKEYKELVNKIEAVIK